jgi:hypothetical protein
MPLRIVKPSSLVPAADPPSARTTALFRPVPSRIVVSAPSDDMMMMVLPAKLTASA